MMGKRQKIIAVALWLGVLLAAGGLVAMQTMRPKGRTFEPLFNAPSFQLTDQNGKPFGSSDLAGKVWVADFVFTHCAGPCPIITAKMAALENQFAPHVDVKFISFTVDPERDTPAVLKEYADRFHADDSRWHFLTGPSDAIYAAFNGFKITALPATVDNPIIHSERFLLIDRAGKVVGTYQSNVDEDVKHLAADIKDLTDRN